MLTSRSVVTRIKMNHLHPSPGSENEITSMLVSSAKTCRKCHLHERPSTSSHSEKKHKEFGALVLAATMNMRQVLSILTSYVLHLGRFGGGTL